jgi:MYXO-CTERM domain-containing protein
MMIHGYSSRLAMLACGLLVLGCGDIRPEEELTTETAEALMAVDPPISDEIEIAAPTLARGQSVEAKVAFGAGIYLVVWSIPTTYPGANLYATRIKTTGEVLDPSGFYLGSGFASEVIFAKDQFVVISTPVTGSPQGDIRATRVLPSGQVLDPEGILVAGDDGSTLTIVHPTVATDGVDFMVAWSTSEVEPTTYRSLRVARVTADGTVLDPGGRLITEFVPWVRDPSIAFDGNQYLLAWSPSMDALYGLRIMKSGQVIDSKPFVIDDFIANHTNVEVLHDGTGFVVGAGVTVNDKPVLRLRRVGANGNVDPGIVDIASGSPGAEFAHLQFDGQNLLVTTVNSSLPQSFAFHATLQGTVLEPTPTLLASNGFAPRVAVNGAEAFAVWQEPIEAFWPGPAFAMGARIGSNGQILDDAALPMSVRADSENAPRVAFDGITYQVARQDSNGFLANRISTGQAVANPVNLPFGNANSDKAQLTHVFSSGASPATTWMAAVVPNANSLVTRVVRVSADGSVLDPVPLELPPSYFGSLVTHQYVGAADSTGAMFIGAQDPSSPPFAVRVTNDGKVSSAKPIGNEPCTPRSVTFDGNAYFLTCATPTGNVPMGDFTGTLRGIRLSTEGEVLDANWLPLVTDSNTLFESFAATFDGKNHFLFWRTEVWGPGYFPNYPRTVALHALRVTPDGKVIEPGAFDVAQFESCGPAAARSLYPAVASTGGKTFAVWSEPANKASCDVMGLDLLGVEITGEGVIGAPFVVSAEDGLEDSPMIATQLDGQALVTYSRFVPEAPYAAHRARARLIGACTCPDGSACVAGQCSTEPPPPPPPPKDPIRFGGCDCRVASAPGGGDIAWLGVLGAIWVLRERRKTRRNVARGAATR